MRFISNYSFFHSVASKTVGDSAVAGTRVEPLPKSDYVPISELCLITSNYGTCPTYAGWYIPETILVVDTLTSLPSYICTLLSTLSLSISLPPFLSKGHRPPAEDPSQTRREANPHLERAYSSYTYASGSTGLSSLIPRLLFSDLFLGATPVFDHALAASAWWEIPAFTNYSGSGKAWE